jgi:glycopeptide antibiotics resistance protein
MIYNYRKYGAISPFRTVMLFSFLFYLQCAYFLTILPLPEVSQVSALTGPTHNLIPFDFVRDFVEKSGFVLEKPGTWLAALKTSEFLQPVFNVLLLFPLGVYLGYFARGKLARTALICLAVSLFFELTQLSALYGIYPRPYRLFDVDDLMLNTLGGVLGYLLFTHALSRLPLPTKEKLEAKTRARGAGPVGYIRRLVAWGLDYAVIVLLSSFFAGLFDVERGVAYAVVLNLYTAGLALLLRGRTPGKALVRVKITEEDTSAPDETPPRKVADLPENASLREKYAHDLELLAQLRKQKTGWFELRLVLRYLIRNAYLLAIYFANTGVAAYNGASQVAALLVYFGLVLFGVTDMIVSARKRRLWYERITHTRNVSTVPPKA